MVSVDRSKRPRDSHQLQQGARASSSAKGFLEAKGSLFPLTMLPLARAFSLLLHPFGCHILWHLLAETPALLPDVNTFSFQPTSYTLDNSGLEAKRKRCLCCRSLHETPNTSRNTSSFLVSHSQGYCQIQPELWLTWVTSKGRQWQVSLKQQVYCSLQAQTATSTICPTQDGDFQW